MNEKLIAPCGMNCALCVAYQYHKFDLNQKGFHRKYCPGCIPRGEHCLHMNDKCEIIGKGLVRFCFECNLYPCERLINLDKRYRTKYHMSMIDNLNYIKLHGINKFLDDQKNKWQCQKCNGDICCHNGLCLSCDINVLITNRKYRWNENK